MPSGLVGRPCHNECGQNRLHDAPVCSFPQTGVRINQSGWGTS